MLAAKINANVCDVSTFSTIFGKLYKFSPLRAAKSLVGKKSHFGEDVTDHQSYL